MPGSHFDDRGHARMVDVTAKAVTPRRAVARCRVSMQPATATAIAQAALHKGDVLAVARLAAIGATKQTSLLIPLCHAIPIEGVEVAFDFPDDRTLQCTVSVRTTARTGVEMEAMTAAALAGLTVYDMCKSIDRSMEVGPITLLEKSGGASGEYRRPEASE